MNSKLIRTSQIKRFKLTPVKRIFSNDNLLHELILSDRRKEKRKMMFSIIYNTAFLGFLYYFFNIELEADQRTFNNPKDMERDLGIKQEKTGVSFNDVKGLDQVITNIKQITDIIKNKDRYREIGAKLPKGFLLTGPPGTGKTLLAKAFANECELPFLYVSGSDFESKYIGETAKKVKALFKKAKKHKPCVIFIDEIDSIAVKRSKVYHSEQNAGLNQLLIEMDGFGTESGIFVIAATNTADQLDSAILRSGRFDKIIQIGLPTLTSRIKLIEHYFSQRPNKLTHSNIDQLAQVTAGFSGAELANLANISSTIAAKNNKKWIGYEECLAANERIKVGIKGRKTTDSELKRVAVKESGKTLICYLDRNESIEVLETSILPLNGEPGYTSFLDRKEQDDLDLDYLVKKTELQFGGRIAEEIILGEQGRSVSSGEEVQKGYQMCEKIVMLMEGGDLPLNELNVKAAKLMNDLMKGVKTKFEANKTHLDTIIRNLLEKESLKQNEIKSIIDLA